MTAFGEPLDQPTGKDAQHCHDTVEDHERERGGLQIEVLLAFEVVREPDQVEPPDRVREKLRHHVGPSLALPEQTQPRHLAGRGDFLVIKLRSLLEERNPEEDPNDTEHAGDDERRAPAVINRYQRDNRRRDEGTDISAGIEQGISEGALGTREPLGDSLDCRRKITPLTQAQRNTGKAKSGNGSDEGMAGRRRRPRKNGNRVTDLDSKTVDKPTEANQAKRIGSLERRIHITILLVSPAELRIQHRLKQGQNLPIDIINRRGKEQQG